MTERKLSDLADEKFAGDDAAMPEDRDGARRGVNESDGGAPETILTALLQAAPGGAATRDFPPGAFEHENADAASVDEALAERREHARRERPAG